MNEDELKRASEWLETGAPTLLQRRKDDDDRRCTLDQKLFYIMRKVQNIDERLRVPFWRRWFR